MTDQAIPKNYPVTTPEVAKMLNLLSDHGLLSSQNNVTSSGNKEAVLDKSTKTDLPIAASRKTKEDRVGPKDSKSLVDEKIIMEDIQAAKNLNMGRLGAVVKAVLPYVIVFTIGLFIYYFFFSKVNFTEIFKSTPKKVVTAKESALNALQKQNLAGFQNWISGFYFDVSNPKALDPEADNSGNGLSNFQKYLLGLNPKTYDSANLGMADSEAIALGINPTSGGKLTDEQKKIVEQYFDMEVVMNRLTLANLEKAKNQNTNTYTSISRVAGAGIRGIDPINYGNNFNSNNATFYESLHQQNNNDQLGINEIDINTNIPGRLEIPSLGINVPIMWSSNPKNFERDLQSGVIHYPGTALPGQIGTVYISGHSSNYSWAKGAYNQVFAKLDKLADNTSFKITVVQKNGKDARLYYVVTHRKEFKATDQEQFKNAGKPVVALSTCWPVGSTAKRLVVFGEQTQVEKD